MRSSLLAYAPPLLMILAFPLGCGRDQGQHNEKQSSKVTHRAPTSDKMPSSQVTLQVLTSDKDEGVRVLAEFLFREIQGDTEGALSLITDNALVKHADCFGGMHGFMAYLKGYSLLLLPNYRKQLVEGKLVAIRRLDGFGQVNSTTAELEVFWRKQDGISVVQVYSIDFVEGGQLAFVGWADGKPRVLLPPVRSLR
jgi:hypothetical protein